MNKNSKKIKNCIDCGKNITKYSLRCQTCAAIFRNKNKDYIKKQQIVQRGQVRSEESKRKMSIGQKKRFENPKNHPNFGKHIGIGKANGRYIDGRTPLVVSIRHLKEYEIWRNLIFKRDNYTCRDCGQVGGYLTVHHIKSFSVIFTEFLKQYSQFSPIEDKETLIRLALSYYPFWNLENGIVLCEHCHKSNYTTRPKS